MGQGKILQGVANVVVNGAKVKFAIVENGGRHFSAVYSSDNWSPLLASEGTGAGTGISCQQRLMPRNCTVKLAMRLLYQGECRLRIFSFESPNAQQH